MGDEELVFKQQRHLTVKQFEIDDSGVKIIEKSPGNYQEYHASFDEIGFERATEKKSTRGWLYVSLFFLLLATSHFIDIISGGKFDKDSMFAVLLIALTTYGIFLYTSKNCVYIVGSFVQLELFRNKPSIKEVDEFVEKILEARRTYLRNKYAKVDKYKSLENQLCDFSRLKDEKVISEEEYEKLREEAVSYSDLDRVVGFKPDSNIT